MKKATLVLLLFTITTSIAFSQKGIELRLTAAPYGLYSPYPGSPLYLPVIGYSTSLNVGISIGKNFSVLTGMKYFQNRYISNDIYYLDSKKITELNLDIPIYFKYQFSVNRINISPIIGTSYSRILGWGIKEYTNDFVFHRVVGGTYNYGHILNLHAGVAADYYFNNRVGFTIEPYINYGTPRTYIGSAIVKYYSLLNYGINLGVV